MTSAGAHDATRCDPTTRGGHPWGCAQVENRDDTMTTLCRFMSSFGCTELVRPERDAARDGDCVDGRRWLSSGRDAPNST